jgi:spore cortex formation protein SpoVR/YcgB (stage V sporulation)
MFAFRRDNNALLGYTIGKFLEKQQTPRGPSMLEMMLSSVLAITTDDKTETAKTADAKTADAETNAAKTADADASKTADASSSTASETDTKEASAPDTPTEAESKPAACKRTTSIFSDENNLI